MIGDCGSYATSSCNSNKTMSIVEDLCVGKTSCEIPVSNDAFGGDPCVNVPKHLDVQGIHITNFFYFFFLRFVRLFKVDFLCVKKTLIKAICDSSNWLMLNVSVPVGSTADVYVSQTPEMTHIQSGN